MPDKSSWSIYILQYHTNVCSKCSGGKQCDVGKSLQYDYERFTTEQNKINEVLKKLDRE